MKEFNLSEMKKKFLEEAFKEIEGNNSIEVRDKEFVKSWIQHTFDGLDYFDKIFIRRLKEIDFNRGYIDSEEGDKTTTIEIREEIDKLAGEELSK